MKTHGRSFVLVCVMSAGNKGGVHMSCCMWRQGRNGWQVTSSCRNTFMVLGVKSVIRPCYKEGLDWGLLGEIKGRHRINAWQRMKACQEREVNYGRRRTGSWQKEQSEKSRYCRWRLYTTGHVKFKVRLQQKMAFKEAWPVTASIN